MSVEKYSALVEKHPENPLFRFSLSNALILESRFQEALGHLEVCLGLRKDWMIAAMLAGKCALQIKKPEVARTHLRNAMQWAVEQNHEEPREEIQHLLSQCGGECHSER